MATVELKAVKREERGKERVGKLRQQGQLPAVLYGPGVPAPLALTLDRVDTEKLILKEGRDAIYELKVGRRKYRAELKEVQRDVLNENFLHVDFYALETSKRKK
ncbi:MAG: hypothetical protein B1H03_03995 [Planctomycetales bacterium 4484_113]|nr:MAG: hypothetical protein B1H03_03995 [Planctomycetales bacterium 4484_113]